jgi:hypothetical protein
MAASLEYCLRIIEDLERRITDLELSVACTPQQFGVLQEQRPERRS